MRIILVILLFFSTLTGITQNQTNAAVLPGAYQTGDYLPQLRGKRVAVVANHTSFVGNIHLVDTLVSRNVNVVKIFGPEHGFRGSAADGATVANETDPKTGIPVISLYGNHKKPTPSDLKNVDVVLFDIQDVGVRFYTYISTLAYVMEACAENRVDLMVLDRPNPNGFYVDGPVLKKQYASFVGIHEVPIVYGMTIGEYAFMVNGEGWLAGGVKCNLQVISCKNYTHPTLYSLPINPSPNLRSMEAVYLYPSLCLFEGTVVSVGRGTDKPFRQIGYTRKVDSAQIEFTPRSLKGISDNPPLKDQRCYGFDVTAKAGEIVSRKQLQLHWLLYMYRQLKMGESFFIPYFEKLSGTDQLRQQIIQGCTEAQIRESWQEDLTRFKKIRKKYLIYEDVEELNR